MARTRMVISDNGVLRRARIDLFTPAEKAIHDAIEAVEVAGTHPLLTQAVIQLGYAQAAVADFVEMGMLEAERAAADLVKPEPWISGSTWNCGTHGPDSEVVQGPDKLLWCRKCLAERAGPSSPDETVI